MSKENTATVYELDKGAYLINKQPCLVNGDRQLKEEIRRSEMYFKNTTDYIRSEQADVLFWTEIEDIEPFKFNVKHYAEILRYIIDENGNKQYFVILPELLNSTLGQYVVHLENKLKEQGIAQCSYNINKDR